MSELSKLYFVSFEDSEWDQMFAHFEDPNMYNAQFGEYLQYLGTTLKDGKWTHEFRHRSIPLDNTRKYWTIPASPSWSPFSVQNAMKSFFPDMKDKE